MLSMRKGHALRAMALALLPFKMAVLCAQPVEATAEQKCVFARCAPTSATSPELTPAPGEQAPPGVSPMTPTPPISAYKDNFIDLGLKSWGAQRPADWVFRMGVKSPLWVAPGSGNGLYFTYRMTGFWDIHADSAPFRDINHNPALVWLHQVQGPPDALPLWRGFEAGVEHISNGQDNTSTGPNGTGNMRSRSIDYAVFVEPKFQWAWPGGTWRYQPRLWIPAGTNENPGIRSEWGLLWNTLSWGDLAELSTKGNPFNKGQAAVKLYLDPDEWLGHGRSQVRLSLTAFNGHGDGLLEYDERRTWVRMGLSFSAYTH